MNLAGDKYALSNSGDSQIELNCDYCEWQGEVWVSETYSHGMVSYHAEFTCPQCNEKNDKDGEYRDED